MYDFDWRLNPKQPKKDVIELLITTLVQNGDNVSDSYILDSLLLRFEGNSYHLKEASKRLALGKKIEQLKPVLLPQSGGF